MNIEDYWKELSQNKRFFNQLAEGRYRSMIDWNSRDWKPVHNYRTYLSFFKFFPQKVTAIDLLIFCYAQDYLNEFLLKKFEYGTKNFRIQIKDLFLEFQDSALFNFDHRTLGESVILVNKILDLGFNELLLPKRTLTQRSMHRLRKSLRLQPYLTGTAAADRRRKLLRRIKPRSTMFISPSSLDSAGYSGPKPMYSPQEIRDYVTYWEIEIEKILESDKFPTEKHKLIEELRETKNLNYLIKKSPEEFELFRLVKSFNLQTTR